jgi:uncharacterized protein (TIGR00661 family)
MEKTGNKHFLICPLNWGLGHASRCIPIIEKLIVLGQKVSIASDGVALDLLKAEFPEIPAFELPSYNIRYRYESMMVNLVLQSPGIFRTVKKEKKVIAKLIEQEGIDIILSDNRFGCRSSRIPSIYITHQSSIEAGALIPSLFANYVHKKWFKRFDECWIPDFMDKNNLAGKLSTPPRGIKSFYIGPLSRFGQAKSQRLNKYNAIFILSGPEPQRTYFEKLIVQQLQGLAGDYLLVRGTSANTTEKYPNNLEVQGLVTAKRLEKLIGQSEIMVCRSGYSSVMDLFYLEKKALLVPTPGQTEQEYLAKYLFNRNLYYFKTQNKLDLKHDLKRTLEFPGFQNFIESWLLGEAIAKWINY